MVNRPRPPHKPVVVNSVLDIRKLLVLFDNKDAKTVVNKYLVDGSEVVFDDKDESKTLLNKCLIDGFEMVKRNLDLDKAVTDINVDSSIYGGFPPAFPPKNEDRQVWLDKMIKTQLGGRREGLKVVWDTIDGKFALDPWTKQLEKVV